MKKVFLFRPSFSKNLNCNGIVIVTQEELDYALDNKLSVYFGEIGIKYSEIIYSFKKEDFSFITEDIMYVNFLEENFKYVFYNPFNCILHNVEDDSILTCKKYINNKLNESRINK